MYPYLLVALVLAALTFAPTTHAQTPPSELGPELAARLDSGFQGDIPVIVKYAGGVDPKALSKEIKKALKKQYPDPKERKAARKALKRSMLLKKLKDQAKAGKQSVTDYLLANGESAEVTELWIINAVAVTLAAELIPGLAQLPGVESIILDAKLQGPGSGTAPTAPNYWNLDATGAPAVWSLGHTGIGVVVATFDTGVDAIHPDLGPRWRGGANSWYDPADQHPTPADHNGHGTQVLGLMVAGAAGGYQVGMAPDAQWIAAKIFDNSNEATLSGIHEAYQWVLDPDGNPATDDAPDILNNSWDLSGSVNACVQEFTPDIALLKESEIAVAFAAGNYGPAANSSVSPANDPAVLSVGAVDYYSNVDIMSSRGANACDGGIYPHLVAPGDGVLTTDRMPGFYNVVGGTSFAVAHVAGGMALLKGAFPDATVSQLEAALMDTAIDLGTAGPDNDYGHGRIDLLAAHDQLEAALGSGGDPNPGSLQFGNATYSVDENVASLSITVTRTGGSAGDVSVDYATADGTALAGLDYSTRTGTLGFADGEVSRSFVVTILDEGEYEGDEEFTLTLSNAVGGASLGTPVSASVTILEDDPQPQPGTLALSAAIYSVAENGASLTVTVNRSGGSDGMVSVNYATVDGTATADLDYETANGVLNFADGQLSQSFSITILDDMDYEGDESLSVDLSNPSSGAALGTPSTATVTITEDDAPPGPGDEDNDEVTDDLDLCPGTPAGEPVDANGCSASQLPPGGQLLFFSTLQNATVPGVPNPSNNADIYAYDGADFSRVLDTGFIGNVDALYMVDADTFYVSFANNTAVTNGGLTLQDEDIGFYDNGVWTMYFDGSADGLQSGGTASANGYDINAIAIDGTTLYFSTAGNVNVGGLGSGDDADIYSWDGATYTREFDASTEDLPGNADIDGLTVKGGTYYMSFLSGGTDVPTLGTVQDEDVVQYNGAWSAYFDGTANGLTTNGHDVDAVHVP